MRVGCVFSRIGWSEFKSRDWKPLRSVRGPGDFSMVRMVSDYNVGHGCTRINTDERNTATANHFIEPRRVKRDTDLKRENFNREWTLINANKNH